MATASEQTIGQEIRQRREALDLSREDLCSKAFISTKTLERIEAGGNPRRGTRRLIEQALEAFEQEPAA